MERDSRILRERDLGSLLNETFSIYGKHLWMFLGLVGVVQVPVSFLTLIPAQGIPLFAVIAAISLFASVCVYGATVFAVGQHYVAGNVAITACYNRVYWRIVTLLVISLVLGLSIVVGVGLAVLIFPTVLLIAFLVFWSLAIPTIIVEGHKPVSALRRSFNLVKGSWWRIFGISVVVFLVVMGLGLALFAPFAIATRIVAPEEANLVGVALEFAGSVIVAVSVPPVAAIAATLLYYDLRVRKENYDLNILSQEMGLGKTAEV